MIAKSMWLSKQYLESVVQAINLVNEHKQLVALNKKLRLIFITAQSLQDMGLQVTDKRLKVDCLVAIDIFVKRYPDLLPDIIKQVKDLIDPKV